MNEVLSLVNKPNNRKAAFESLRFIAVFAVVVIHYFPSTELIQVGVKGIARFAVPYFFVLSGYFFYNEKFKVNIVWGKILRILQVFGFWIFIYFLLPSIWAIKAEGVDQYYLGKASDWFLNGFERWLYPPFANHLWFLISLVMTQILYFVFFKGFERLFVYIGFGLYCFGVLGRGYCDTSWSFDLGFNTRNFVFFSMLPFSIGVLLRKEIMLFHLLKRFVLVLFVFAIGMQLFESYFIYYKYQGDIKDYGFSTFLLGVSIFLIGAKKVFSVLESKLSVLGNYSLGIYCVHILVGERVYRFLKHLDLGILGAVLCPVLITALSLFIVFLMKKNRFLNKFV